MWGEVVHQDGRARQVNGDLACDVVRGYGRFVEQVEALLHASIENDGVDGGEIVQDSIDLVAKVW